MSKHQEGCLSRCGKIFCNKTKVMMISVNIMMTMMTPTVSKQGRYALVACDQADAVLWSRGDSHISTLQGNAGHLHICSRIEEQSVQNAMQCYYAVQFKNDTVIQRYSDTVIHSDTMIQRNIQCSLRKIQWYRDTVIHCDTQWYSVTYSAVLRMRKTPTGFPRNFPTSLFSWSFT